MTKRLFSAPRDYEPWPVEYLECEEPDNKAALFNKEQDHFDVQDTARTSIEVEQVARPQLDDHLSSVSFRCKGWAG